MKHYGYTFEILNLVLKWFYFTWNGTSHANDFNSFVNVDKISALFDIRAVFGVFSYDEISLQKNMKKKYIFLMMLVQS